MGFRCFRPSGAYYIMTDISAFGFADDLEFARHLVSEVGIAVVPGSSFYRDAALGVQQVRFTLQEQGHLGRGGSTAGKTAQIEWTGL